MSLANSLNINTQKPFPASQTAFLKLSDDHKDSSQVFDLLGVGFGPSNLSISVRLAEENLEISNPFLKDQIPVDESLRTLDRKFKTCFVESNECFRWHPGMMIDGSRMQISFLKDLVTLRNPCSPFSFLNYLRCHQRLIDFINRATFTPTRLEFADYLSWVSRQVVTCSVPSPTTQITTAAQPYKNSIDICYGERVLAVEGLRARSGNIDLLRVSSIKFSDNSPQQYLCRNLIISTGGAPRIPEPFQGLIYSPAKKSSHVLHTSAFLHHIDHILQVVAVLPNKPHRQLESSSNSTVSRPCSPISSSSALSSDRPKTSGNSASVNFDEQTVQGTPTKLKLAFIGAGQSAAETLLETYNRLKSSLCHLEPSENGVELHLIIRQGCLRPSDDSSFSNEVFNPASTDFFYKMCAETGPTKVKMQRRKKKQEFLLNESASTNYAVVSPHVLTTLYEIIYAQKVEEGMEENQKRWNRSHDPKIKIINYSHVVSAESNLDRDGSVDVVLENVLTGHQTKAHYHAVILATGYSKQNWRQILFSHSEDYSGSGVRLGDLWPNLSTGWLHPCSSNNSRNGDSSTNSIISNEEADNDTLSETSSTESNDIKIARNYRLLLPETFVEKESSKSTSSGAPPKIRKFRPTIWLQGCNESTHGISDSLLSVLSVRSEEIVNGVRKEGWFNDPSEKTDEKEVLIYKKKERLSLNKLVGGDV